MKSVAAGNSKVMAAVTQNWEARDFASLELRRHLHHPPIVSLKVTLLSGRSISPQLFSAHSPIAEVLSVCASELGLDPRDTSRSGRLVSAT